MPPRMRTGYDIMPVTPLTPALSPQARLGELASQRGRIRKRMRLERSPLATVEKASPLPHPHSLANADAISCKLAKASLLRGTG